MTRFVLYMYICTYIAGKYKLYLYELQKQTVKLSSFSWLVSQLLNGKYDDAKEVIRALKVRSTDNTMAKRKRQRDNDLQQFAQTNTGLATRIPLETGDERWCS